MRHTFAFDTETFLIEPGILAPKLVSFAYRVGNRPSVLLHAGFHLAEIRHVIEWALREAIAGRLVIVGHNVCYDMAVLAATFPDLLPLIFEAYDRDGIECSKINEMLIDLYRGALRGEEDEEGNWTSYGYSLDDVSQRRLDRKLDKGPDGWRLRYGELFTVPLEQWPERAYSYAIDDADVEHDIDRLQRIEADELSAQEDGGHILADAGTQAAGDFGLHLMCCRGMITEAEYVAELERQVMGAQRRVTETLVSSGILRREVYKRTGLPKRRKDGRPKLTMSKAAEQAYVSQALTDAGLPVRYTAPSTRHPEGQISTKKETFLQLTHPTDGSEPEPVLLALETYKDCEKLAGNNLPVLWSGVRTPIQPRVNILVDTGRTSMAKPNLQNPPRELSKLVVDPDSHTKGVRECFVPRPGFVFCSVDYSVAELRALAQVCLWLFGYSKMAELFQHDVKGDPHIAFATAMSRGEFGSFDDFKRALKDESHDQHKRAKKLRKDAKAANFGFPGGMGPRKFVETNAKVGNFYTEDEAKELRGQYLGTWIEMEDYFALHKRLVGFHGDTVRIQHFRSGRYRGGCSYPEACNTRFQGLTADIAKRAMFRIQMECYTGRFYDGRPGVSPLYGSALVNFLHDEGFAELREDCAHEAAHRMAEIMVETADEYMPDVPSYAEPALMLRWYKDAATVYSPSGLLIPWEPKPAKADRKAA